MQNLSDSVLIEQLKTEDNAAFQLLYNFYFPSISAFVKQNSGNNEDAEDIFQEAIIVLLHKVRQSDFVLTAALKTYLFAIAKNLWLKRLRGHKLVSVEDFEAYIPETETFSVEIKPEKTREEKLTDWLMKIPKHCQNILKAIFFLNEPMDDLMVKMGWKNRHTADNQKYKCIQQVKNEKKKEEAA
jgi:RNA polymerase sigma factor (sigma-70 family)